ncbi:MAG: hypothetical protein ACYC4Q_04690, partial [Victivallaceae bacterium]
MEKRFASLLAVLAALILYQQYCTATTYYVDSVNGSNSNSGTSEAQAWKTLGKIQTCTFINGDIISFKKGGKWYPGQEIIHPDTTTGYVFQVPSNVAKINAYGTTGNKPEIWGTVSLNGNNTISWGTIKSYQWLSQTAAAWMLYSSTPEYYKKPISRCPNAVFHNEAAMTPVSIPTTADSFTLERGQWTYISPSHTKFPPTSRDCIVVRLGDGSNPADSGNDMQCSALNIQGTAAAPVKNKGLITIAPDSSSANFIIE